MCRYCEEREKNIIKGQDFDLLPTAGFRNDMVYSSWIMKNENDEKAGIMIATNYSNAVYFDINYCPICGRKLRSRMKIIDLLNKIANRRRNTK